MNRKQNSRAIYYISLILIAAFWGCSVEQKEKTLSFFFDGVPSSKQTQENNNNKNNKTLAANTANIAKKAPEQYFHKPYLERKCESCHTPDRHLLKPLPDLCYQCHTDFRETYKYVHGPVVSGNCTKCHNQHAAKYPKLLIRDGQQLCLYCHKSSLVFDNKYHKKIEDASCTLCHNPHGGKTRFMIRDGVAGSFNGLALINEIASRHLFAQLYNKVPGDIKAGTEVIIQDNDQNFEVVSVSPIDARGMFSMDNVHPNENYTIKTKSDLPDSAKIYLLDYKDRVVYVMTKNKKGKFIFDKSAYDIAHAAIAPEKAKEADIFSTAKSITNSDASVAITDSNNSISTVKDVPAVIAGGVAFGTAAPTGDSKNEPAETSKAQPPAVTGSTNSGIVPGGATGGDISPANPVANVILVKQSNDSSTVKLAGHSYKFKKGSSVRFLNLYGDIVATAKIDTKGNFNFDKIANNPNGTFLSDTGDYAQTIVLNTEFAPGAKDNNPDATLFAGPGAVLLGKKQSHQIPYLNAQLFTVIYYEFARYKINREGINSLNKVVEYLKKYPGVNAYMTAHTDSRGSMVYNQQLSNNRVYEALNYITSRGILPDRIIIKGLGKTKLKNKCSDGIPCSEEEHKENRRVEISIIVK